MILKSILTSFILLFTSAVVADAENIKIGVILPLTGPLAEYGVASRNGIELAKKTKPDLFLNLEFIYEDSQYDPKLAISAYRKLRDDSLVKVIYNWGSNPSAPLIPIAEKESFPLVVADFSSQPFKNSQHVIAFAPTSDQLGGKLHEALARRNYKKLALLSVENLYVQGIVSGLKNALDGDEKIVLSETVLATETDFRSHIAKLKSRQFDALGVMLYAGQIQNLYRNLQAANFSKATFGSDFMESRVEIQASGNLIEGAIYPHLNVTDEYYKLYRMNYNSDSQVTSSGSAYDLAFMLAKLQAENPRFYETFSDKVSILDAYKGVMGEYKYQVSADSGKRLFPPVHVKMVKDGFYTVLE